MVDPLDDLHRDGAAAAPDVPGYSVGRRLGAGGSAVVWAATRDTDGAPVAVKVVTVGAGAQAEAAVRELGVLARVDVEGLVRFHEAVSLPGEDRRVALVLDLVAGGSLHGVVRARGHLSVGESVTVLAPVARTLAGLHAAGVLHGDVSPANVLLERAGRPLLADLGVARFVGEAPGEALGTEGFVAPEVVDGGPVTPAADVYAAGALAWWCVTGEAPGPASWRQPLESLAPGLPEPWRAATVRALSSDPAGRPSAAELALAWFDSAQCEPLRLVVGTDETSLLTHRLRRPPSELHEPAPPAHGRWHDRVARCALVVRDRPRVAAGLAAAGLAAVLLLGALLAAGALPTPAWVGPRQQPTGTGSLAHDEATSGAVADRRAVQQDPRAPVDRPQALMQELANLRARAMASGRAADLAAVDAPGSPASRRDEGDLRAVRLSGSAYEGVRLTVRSARTVTVSGQAATIDAVVDTAAYRVVAVTGGERTVQGHAAVPGPAVRFALTWSGGLWRVERVEPVA